MPQTGDSPIDSGSLSAWWLALRPKTLLIAVAVVAVGTGVAAATAQMALLPAVAALLGALLLQIASHFANDLFDFRKGADGPDRLGPTRAVASGMLSQRQMVSGLVFVSACALGVGVYLSSVGGLPIVVIGVAGLASAVLYTGGPWPLGYHGLGDLFVFLFFGLAAVAGTCYVQTGVWEPLGFVLGAAMGLLAAAVLTINNIRDLSSDARVGKRTVAVRLGRRGAERYFLALLGTPYLLVGGLVVRGDLPALSLVTLLSLPLAVSLGRQVAGGATGVALNPALGRTAGLLTLFGLLLLPGLFA